MAPLILIANPGSASRKYALFRAKKIVAELHFEYRDERVICTLTHNGSRVELPVELPTLKDATSHVVQFFKDQHILTDETPIGAIGLRVVAPGAFFLQHRQLDEAAISQLEALEARAPLHIKATLTELRLLRRHFPHTPIFGLSDSAFHHTKPDYAWNYGITLADADQFDIKRFGYHGLSVGAAVESLRKAHKLAPKTVVCHMGSGISVTAVHEGQSHDTTMGYSPLEGPLMATRSGSVDYSAIQALKEARGFSTSELETYLNAQSGLLGLGGSSDVRELLQREAHGDHYAALALKTFVYSIQKAIGQMSAALGGMDLLVLTGTIGERSAPIRQRLVAGLGYLDFFVETKANHHCTDPQEATIISRLAHSRPVYVVPTNEATEMARHLQELLK
ncbi:MAG TPA: hypothetical protein VLF60_02790 [Candidatus Saccharimonadales bacterium]|nr:hypothetical protein [Candidatus Saccharimonadales bacterium]